MEEGRDGAPVQVLADGVRRGVSLGSVWGSLSPPCPLPVPTEETDKLNTLPSRSYFVRGRSLESCEDY